LPLLFVNILRMKKIILPALLASFGFLKAQEKPKDSITQLNEVVLSAVRAKTNGGFTNSTITAKELAPRNLGQDVPTLLNFMPAVVTTSDAGTGIGYSGIRVRGSDATRVNVTLNGIPYNDPESQGTFWVNLPDFSSSVSSIQLQRGVGTSTNGAGAFGASLAINTENTSYVPSLNYALSAGNFGTLKNTLEFNSGRLNNNFEFNGRLSKIQSDGYVDRASVDLKSYFLQGSFFSNKTTIKALVFGGNEKTYQSWNGIDPFTMEEDRTYNSAGFYIDANGNERFYDNETDNYQQEHAQLHVNTKWNSDWQTNVALHYTKGKGYYENFIQQASLVDYSLATSGDETTNLVRQKWLDNDFFGTTYSATYSKNQWQVIAGGAMNRYEGAHFGKVVWSQLAPNANPDDRYYDFMSIKTDVTNYVKVDKSWSNGITVFADMQLRNVGYKTDGVQENPIDDTFNFFNPKAGITYDLNTKNNFYLSVAKAQREPNRTDYEYGEVKPEELLDYELGWRYNTKKLRLNANAYYMDYTNQLILTGNLDDVGNPIRSNTEQSYRMGVELEAALPLSEKFTWQSNLSLSKNTNENLQINGENIGDKQIAFSPSVVGASNLTFTPLNNISFSWLSKFVGEQYINNIELADAKLPSYWVNDLNISYTILPKKGFKEIQVNALVNNFLNRKYVSNGYMYDIYPYFYPQAGAHFLIGVNFFL
jgi:iron complex outermembrane recepter protein